MRGHEFIGLPGSFGFEQDINRHRPVPKVKERLGMARPKQGEDHINRELVNAKKLVEYLSRIREGTHGDYLSSGLKRQDFAPRMKGPKMKGLLEETQYEFSPIFMAESLQKAYKRIARMIGLSEKQLPAQAYASHEQLFAGIQGIREGIKNEARSIAPAIHELTHISDILQTQELLDQFRHGGFTLSEKEHHIPYADVVPGHAKGIYEDTERLEALQRYLVELENPITATVVEGPHPKFAEVLPVLKEFKDKIGTAITATSDARIDALTKELNARYRVSLQDIEQKPTHEQDTARQKAQEHYGVWISWIQKLKEAHPMLVATKQKIIAIEQRVRTLNRKVSKTVLPICDTALTELLKTQELRQQTQVVSDTINEQITYLDAQEQEEQKDEIAAFHGIPLNVREKIKKSRADLKATLHAMRINWQDAVESMGTHERTSRVVQIN